MTAELIQALASGDEQALARIYDAHGAAVYALALRITRTPADAEEVTQEVFLQAWRSAARFDADRGLWRDCREVPPEPPPLPMIPRPSPEKLARLRARSGSSGPVSEVQLVYIFAPIAHGSERPYVPRAWLCADSRTGIIAMSELMEPERGLDCVQDAFLALLEDGTPIPAEIRTADALSQALLAPIAEALGVRLRLVGATPRLAEAREAMAVMLRRGFADGPPWAD